MKAVQTSGGTNMFPAIRQASEDLNHEANDHPDFASALYFFGDGGDTRGNSGKIRQFLQMSDQEGGFGDHMRSAILLGGSQFEKRELAALFGDENTHVASSLDKLIEASMHQFHDDLFFHLEQTGAI